MALVERIKGHNASGGEPDSGVGQVLIDDVPSALKPEELEKRALNYLDKPEKKGIGDFAKRNGRDIVAAVTSRGTVLYIGAGIAAAIIAAGIGAVVIYEHNKKK